MFYAIGRELFSGQSPSGVYSRAFKLCRKHEKVCGSVIPCITECCTIIFVINLIKDVRSVAPSMSFFLT